MYDHVIDDQVKALVEAGLVNKKHVLKAKKVLRQKCWTDQMALIWTVEDVKDLVSGRGKVISDEQAQDVLEEVLRRHDASIGVNWDVISEFIPDDLEEEEKP